MSRVSVTLTVTVLAGVLLSVSARPRPPQLPPSLPLPRVPAPAAAAAAAAAAEARAAAAAFSAAAGYCAPSDACWPTAAQWAALNASVGGGVLALRPEGAPCVVAPLSPACAEVEASWTNASWRRAQPGASQYPLWEADARTGANCWTPGAPCSQGNVPPFAVAARTAAAGGVADVAAALRFAQAHNLRLVVKASGHDMQGRSTGAGALLVWLAALDAVAVHADGFRACDGDAATPAVTAQPGATAGALQAALGDTFVIVTGSARTVSAAGGHVLGGGHSYASPAYGLAADNLLAAQVALATGSVVTASACSHADLFWALRGGGGSSVGIVLNATYRLHPNPPVGVTGMELGVELKQGVVSADLLLQLLFSSSPALLDPARSAGGVWGGYWFLTPGPTGPASFAALLVFNGSQAAAESSISSVIARLAGDPAQFSIASLAFTPYANMNAFHEAIDPPPGETTGSWSAWGSRLLPAAAVTDAARLANVSAALATVAQYVRVLGHLVAGGAVAAADPTGAATALTPAWRTAVGHLLIQTDFASNASVPDVQGTFSAVSYLTGLLRAALPDSGAYFNEADYLEPQWQETFWGANYQRLQSVKAAYDPLGRFSCWHCVELPSTARAAERSAAKKGTNNGPY